MDIISILLWVLAVCLLIVICIPKMDIVPICMIAETISAGGFICAINEFNAGGLTSDVALFVSISMLAVMIFALMKILTSFMSNARVRF